MKNLMFFITLFLPLLLQAQKTEIKPVVQFGHLGSEISEMVISKDGSLMATTDGIIVKLWDLKTGLEIRSIAEQPIPTGKISKLGFSSDGNTFGYLYAGYAILRSVEDGSFTRQYPALPPEPDTEINDAKQAEEAAKKQRTIGLCTGILFNPVQNLVGIIYDKSIEIRAIGSFELKHSLLLNDTKRKFNFTTNDLNFSSDGMALISGRYIVPIDGGDIKNIARARILRDSTKDYRDFASLVTQDTKYLISGYSVAEKLDSIQNRLARELEEKLKKDSTYLDNEQGITQDSGAVFLPFYLLPIALKEQAKSFAENGTIIISNPSNGQIYFKIDTIGISSLVLSPDNTKIATSHQKGWVYIWDLATGKAINKIKIDQPKPAKESIFYSAPIPKPKVIFTPDSKGVIIASKYIDAENIAVWDISTGQKVKSIGADIPLLNIDVQNVGSKKIDMREFIKISSSLYLFPYTYDIDQGYRAIDLATGKVPSAFVRDTFISYDSITFSPDRSYYFLQEGGNLAAIHHAELNEKQYLDDSTERLQNACFSHDNRYVAASTRNKIIVWDRETGKQIYTNDLHELLIVHLSFDPKGRFLVSCGEDDRVGFWDINIRDAKEPVAFIGPPFNQSILGKVLRNPTKYIDMATATINKGQNALGTGKDIIKNPVKALEGIIKNPFPPKKTNTTQSGANTSSNFGSGFLNSARRINDRTDINLVRDLLQFKGGYDVSYSADGQYAAIWINNYYSVKVVDLEATYQTKQTSQTKQDSPNKDKKNPKPNKPDKPAPAQEAKQLGEIQDFYLMAWQKYVLGGRKGDTLATKKDSTYLLTSTINNFKRQFNLKSISAFSNDFQRLASYKTTIKPSFPRKDDTESKIKKGIFIQCTDKKQCDEIWLDESEGFNEGLVFRENIVAASSRSANVIKVWDATTGKVVKILAGHSGKLSFSPNGKVLFSSGWDRQIKAFDFETGQELYSFIAIKGTNDYIVILPNGYYTASRRNSKAIAFAKGRRAYPFEQFDVMFNRPDSLLEKFGKAYQSGDTNPNEALIKAYNQAYTKRLENLGFDEAALSSDVHLPEASLGAVSASAATNKISLNIKAKDELYNLDRLQIYVNGVPVFGTKGIDLKKFNKKTYEGKHEIELTPKGNTIQVSVFNVNGVESLRETANVVCTAPEVKPNLYLVLAGVAAFQDSSMNLGSPINDLKAIAALFGTKSKEYGQIIPITLYDKDFTRDKFRQVKTQLQKSTVNDQVIIAVASHGILDAKYNYYLATYDTDFKNPAATALPYRELELMFEGVKARQRIAFLDACHAGELDTTEVKELSNATKANSSLTFRKGFRSSQWNSIGISASFDLMKDLFVDVRKGSGATIIGSARGVDLAIDGGTGKVSVFTQALLEGLRDKKADTPAFDGKITVNELQQYLGKKVENLTRGVQKPVYRTENLGNDWKIW